MKKKANSVLISKTPNKEPKVLGPTTKVKSVGPILGGTPKKNPTLTTKFFGTCSANNDPGSKKILGEGLVYELSKLKNLRAEKGAALILPNNKVYVARSHWILRNDLQRLGIVHSLSMGTVRIRYEGTAGFTETAIEFEKADEATIQRVFWALDNVNSMVFKIEYTGDLGWKSFLGNKDTLKMKIEEWASSLGNDATPRYSSDLQYWRMQESKNNNKLLEFSELSKLNHLTSEEGAAFVMPSGRVYIGQYHDDLKKDAYHNGDDTSISSGVIRVREAGSGGFNHTTIQFGKLDKETLERVFKVIDALAINYHGLFDAEYIGRPGRKMTGNVEEVKIMLGRLLRGYERDQSSRTEKVIEAKTYREVPINYKSFKNASKAVSKICPACTMPFKNISDPKQIFCSQNCEDDGKTELQLKEAFERFM